MGKKYEEIGRSIGAVVDEKNRAYGSSFSKSGEVMRILYPEGIPTEKLDDALTVVRVLDKLFRIATDRDALGEDPWGDIAGYAVLSVQRVRKKKGDEGRTVLDTQPTSVPGFTCPLAASVRAHRAEHDEGWREGASDLCGYSAGGVGPCELERGHSGLHRVPADGRMKAIGVDEEEEPAEPKRVQILPCGNRFPVPGTDNFTDPCDLIRGHASPCRKTSRCGEPIGDGGERCVLLRGHGGNKHMGPEKVKCCAPVRIPGRTHAHECDRLYGHEGEHEYAGQVTFHAKAVENAGTNWISDPGEAVIGPDGKPGWRSVKPEPVGKAVDADPLSFDPLCPVVVGDFKCIRVREHAGVHQDARGRLL